MVIGGKNLKSRHKIEEQFHDTKVNKKTKETALIGHANYAIAELVRSIGDYRGKRILEIGCGKDGLAIYLGKRGAITEGIDISGECILHGNKIINNYGIDNRVKLRKLAAEEIDYPNESFDLVIGNAVLHHCDISITLNKINNILKKNGKGVFIEPLDHNFLLRAYRAFTPNQRSSTETPFRFSHFKIFKNVFNKFEHREMFLTSLFCYFLYGIIPSNKLFQNLFDFLNKLDERLLKAMPFLRKYCWVVMFSFKKKSSNYKNTQLK